MFVELLDLSQKALLIDVMCQIAMADGGFDPDESTTIERYALSLGLNANEVNQKLSAVPSVDPRALEALPEQAKRVIFIEAQTLAMLDNNFDAGEHRALQALADRLELSKSVVSQIDDYVRRGFDWAKAGNALVGGS